MNVAATGATTSLHWLSVAQAARAIAHRELSPVELTQALLDRIARLDPHEFLRRATQIMILPDLF
jgi:Asp-tRNA(Asn)/Glu-tRNA(Gln) amidotransferase A subunit family amidase